jgi:hypothetical protein
LTGVLITGLSINCRKGSRFSRLIQHAEAGVDRIFEQFTLEISNAANYENCVPQKDE